jgi:hypothetical protein
LQISTSPDTNLKFFAALEREGEFNGDFIPWDLLATAENDAYASTSVTLNGTSTAGMHRLSIIATDQTANTVASGAAFSSYGSLVSVPFLIP